MSFTAEESSLPHGSRAPAREATLTGVVLCGGLSRRMTRDKAQLELGEGTSLLQRAAGQLGAVASQVVLACGPTPRYGELGLELVLDELADAGPLAGLAAALAASPTEWVAALACDMPRADARLVRALFERARERDADACLFATDEGLEPLLAVYRRSCLGPVREALSAGQRRMIAFHDRLSEGRALRVEVLAEGELDSELRERSCALNLNTPEEFEAERRRTRRGRAS